MHVTSSQIVHQALYSCQEGVYWKLNSGVRHKSIILSRDQQRCLQAKQLRDKAIDWEPHSRLHRKSTTFASSMPCSPRCTCCANKRLALKALTSLRSILLYLISSSTRGLSDARTTVPHQVENPDGRQSGCGTAGLGAAQIGTLHAPSGDAAGMYVAGQVNSEQQKATMASLCSPG